MYFPEHKVHNLAVTAVGASGAAVTATLPGVSGLYHYISRLEITLYAAVALVAGATPLTVTTTNLPGNPAFTFPTLLALGNISQQVLQPNAPFQSSAAGAATTVVCPAVTGGIWRVNALYFSCPGP